MALLKRMIQVGIDARLAKAGAAQVDKSFKQIEKGADRGRRALTRYDARQKAVKAGAVGLSRHLTTLVGGFTALIAVRATIGTYAKFEETMATVGEVAGATEEQFAKLTGAARQLGATTRFTATEAGEGLLFLARAGFTSQEAMEALPATLNLATAGMLGLGEAADFASNIVSQFNLSAAETVRVVDTLVATSNASNTNVRQLAEAMKFAGPVAGALGISVEQTAAAIGVLGDSGIQASMAGTNLRGMLASLLQPSGRGKAALKELGLTIKDLDPTTNSLIDIFGRLQAAELSAADAVGLFGRRNAAAALVLTSGVVKINELTEANNEAAGTAQRFADVLNKTLIGQFKAFKSAVEAIVLNLGFANDGVFRDFLTTLVGAARHLAGVSVMGEEASGAAKTLAVTVQFLVMGFSALLALKLVTFFGSLALSMTTAAGAAVKMATATVVLTGALSALVGFSFGTFIFEEFKGIQKAFVNFGKVGAELIENLRFAVIGTINDIRVLFFDLLNDITVELEKFAKTSGSVLQGIALAMPGGGVGMSAAVAALSAGGVAPETGELRDSALRKQARGLVAHTQKLSAIQELTDKMLLEIELDFGDSARKTGDSFNDNLLGRLERTMDDAAAIIIGGGKKAQVALDELGKDINVGLSKEGIALIEKYVAQIAAIGDVSGKTEKQIAKLKKGIQGQIEALRFSNVLIGMDTEARKKHAAITQFETDVIEAFGEGMEEGLINIAIFTHELEKLTANEDLRRVSDEIGDAFGDMFEDVILGTESVEDAFETLLRNVQQIIFEELFTKQIAKLVSNIAFSAGQGIGFGGESATGNVFRQGSVTAFGHGGITNGPELFPMSGNRVGLRGEGMKPEAVVPLPDGRKIPVELSGRGGVTNINVEMKVIANDPNAFRLSERQMVDSVTRRFKRAL